MKRGFTRRMVILLLLFSAVFHACFVGCPAVKAIAEDDPYEYDPYRYDEESIPFLLFNVEGSTPGIDRESEWTLALKPDWEDQGLPERVTSVEMRLYCLELDWTDNWSHVWAHTYEGYPDVIICTEPKVGGRYRLTAIVRYDDTLAEVNTGFVVPGAGSEQIQGVIEQAAAACKAADDWQTARNLYDWLLSHLVYDSTLSYYSSDAILRGTGVCDSYARLYFLLCQAAGLDAYVVYGNTRLAYHAWDAVRIGDSWYYADPTWDDHPQNDPAMSQSIETDENGVRYGTSEYRYFMISKQLMMDSGHLTFQWLDESKFPCEEQPATSLAASYIVHTGQWTRWGIVGDDGFRTIPDLIREGLEGSERMWSSKTLTGRPLSTRDSDASAFLLSDFEIAHLEWLLKGYSMTLSDGTPVTLETHVYDAPDMSGRVLNVYVQGQSVTDEPGYYELPQDLTHIEAEAFAGDRHAGEVICPPGLVSIGSRAFANCRLLWSIRIPSDVQFIADDAFDGCGEFCIWTEHRDSLPARYAEEHGITLFVDDEEEGSNG